jgi:hypothetical protein
LDSQISGLIETNIDQWAPKLARLAQRRINLRVFSGRYGGRIPGGLNSSDIVQNAILKTLSGERKWDPKKEPDLFNFLKWAMYSEISALAKKLENKLSAEPGKDREDEDAEPFENNFADEEKSQLEAMENHEHLTNFYVFLEGEPDLQILVEFFDKGFKRQDIAEKLGKAPTVITNLKKRLKIKYREFLSAQEVRQ